MKPINHHIFAFLLLFLLASPAVQAATADDVECIRCVDTTDINYDAVTSNRILDGTIRTSDLGLDAVTSSRIRAGEVRTSDLAPSAVTTSRIMNGAVTEAKLAQELLDIISQLQAEVAYLMAQNAQQQAILSHFSIHDLHDPSTGNYYPTLRITGANLQLVNGASSTQTANGTGNLILGYNQLPGVYRCSDGDYPDAGDCIEAGEIWSNSHHSGSHNLVIGEGSNYSSYGGIVGGFENTINSGFNTVLGGRQNTSSGDWALVLGGYGNRSTGNKSIVVGGSFNESSGVDSTLSGGSYRSASGTDDWVAGSLLEDF